jgi:hypothetical protein
MKSIDQLEHNIEVWNRGKWMSCPDVRLLEAGDIIRKRDAQTGKLVGAYGRQQHVIVQSLKLNVRAPTLREYESLNQTT